MTSLNHSFLLRNEHTRCCVWYRCVSMHASVTMNELGDGPSAQCACTHFSPLLFSRKLMLTCTQAWPERRGVACRCEYRLMTTARCRAPYFSRLLPPPALCKHAPGGHSATYPHQHVATALVPTEARTTRELGQITTHLHTPELARAAKHQTIAFRSRFNANKPESSPYRT